MIGKVARVLLAISPLMVLFDPANADTSSMDNALARSEECFAESIPVFNVVLQEFETSYLECLLYEETAFGKPYGHINQSSKNAIAAAREDDSGLYENYAVDPVEKCQNASKRAYVENTARNFKVLHICLKSTESLVSTTTEMTTVENEVSGTALITTTTTGGADVSTGSTLLPSTTDIGNGEDEPPTTTQKSVEPPEDNGSSSNLKANVSYLLLGLNIMKYAFYS